MQFNAEAIVLILFGGNWLSIVPLIKIMCISHALSSLFVFHPTTLVSLGKASNVMKLSATLAIAQVLVILAYGHFELTYIFAALITIPLVRLIAIRKDLRDLCAITLRDASGILFVPAIAFTAIYLSNYLVQTLWLSELSAYLYFLCSGLISALVLTLVVFTMNNPLKDVLIPAMASILNRLSHKTASPIKGASRPSPHRQYEEKENS